MDRTCRVERENPARTDIQHTFGRAPDGRNRHTFVVDTTDPLVYSGRRLSECLAREVEAIAADNLAAQKSVAAAANLEPPKVKPPRPRKEWLHAVIEGRTDELLAAVASCHEAGETAPCEWLVELVLLDENSIWLKEERA